MSDKVYKVGDWVWYATYDSEEIKVPCPVCYGNKVVTVILGNGDEVTVECDYCGKGWQNAPGYVTEYQRIPKAEQHMITKRRIEDGRDGEEIEYISSSYILRIEQMFDDEQEAYDYAVGLAEKVTQDNLDKPKYKNEKSYTWNAGYHLKNAASKRKEAEYHEAKAKICKARSKE
jgi:hypothetical protein